MVFSQYAKQLSRDCAIRTIKRTVRVAGSRHVENTRRERTLSIPYHERTRSVPREYLDHTTTILHCMTCRTATVPRPNLDHTATVPRPNLDHTMTEPRPYCDRTRRVPVVRFVNFSMCDTVNTVARRSRAFKPCCTCINNRYSILLIHVGIGPGA